MYRNKSKENLLMAKIFKDKENRVRKTTDTIVKEC